MSENPSIATRANQMLAMLTPEEKAKLDRKSEGRALELAVALATQEKKSGQRTPKLGLMKKLLAAQPEAL